MFLFLRVFSLFLMTFLCFCVTIFKALLLQTVNLTPLSFSLSHISLVVLVALNMLLFYKLYALERAAHTLETWHSYSVADR